MTREKIRIAVLGSTGSIGQQTLDVLRTFPERFNIVALAAGFNIELLANQVREFHPDIVHYIRPAKDSRPADNLLQDYPWLTLEEIAVLPIVDIVVIATSGKTGLLPTLAAAKASKKIALANKEALIIGGAIIIPEARRHKAKILPIDSEHSAIWQCLRGEKTNTISRIILTASGGPFYHYTQSQLDTVTVSEALKHPTWKMGRKVTIDSATLMNKGMEILEAHWLFHVPLEKIQVVIHPQSIVHSMIEFTDGSTKAQLSYPDMRLPVQYALLYPERPHHANLPSIDWTVSSQLTFNPVNKDKFPCLQLALEAGKKGGTYPAVLSAADEVAVELFLSGMINFTDIAKIIEYALKHHNIKGTSIEDILAADIEARAYAREWGRSK